MSLLGLTLVILGSSCSAFVHQHATIPFVVPATKSTVTERSNNRHDSRLYLSEDQLPLAVIGARREFFTWFVGASGGAGIARSQFPVMYDNMMQIRGLKDQGPSKGGQVLDLNPLCGYPTIYLQDVLDVINHPMTVEQIVEQYPIENNFLSKKGYLTFAAFCQAHSDPNNPSTSNTTVANPLAVRAVFDTFAQSTNVVEPQIAQQKLDSYRENVDNFQSALLVSKFQSISAIVALLLVLGLADVLAFGAASRGWFPDWPGLNNLPSSLIDPGFWTIPGYWI